MNLTYATRYIACIALLNNHFYKNEPSWEKIHHNKSFCEKQKMNVMFTCSISGYYAAYKYKSDEKAFSLRLFTVMERKWYRMQIVYTSCELWHRYEIMEHQVFWVFFVSAIVFARLRDFLMFLDNEHPYACTGAHHRK